jgi:rubrerythrin
MMDVKIDFSKLSANDALDLAISIEDEGTYYYEQLADWVRENNPEVSEFFARMAQRERRHRDQIVALRQRLFGGTPSSDSEKVSWGVEVPDFEALSGDITLGKAFGVAMDSETRAHDFYAEAIEYAADDQIAELFEGLRKSEAEHQRMVKEEMEKFLG